MSNVRETPPAQADAICMVLESNGYNVTELTFDVASPNTDYNLAYINILQVGNHIILPTSGIDEDQQLKSTLLSPPLPSIPSAIATSPNRTVRCTALHRMWRCSKKATNVK